MESLFNIGWALTGAIGITAGVVFRWRIATWAKREMARDVVLLGLIVVLLLPVISISDDIGYFSYYFSGTRSPDGIFWAKGSRREKQLHLLPILLTFAVLPTVAASVFYPRMGLETIALAGAAGTFSRRLTASYLRAPPAQA